MLGVGASIWLPVTLGSGGSSFLAGATLDMNFAMGQYLGATPSNMTVVRASTAYADDLTGNWTSFSANQPRITNKGLLIEEAKTNVVIESQNQLGSGWAPTGLTVTGPFAGAPDGSSTVYVFDEGTGATGHFSGPTQITATASTAYTGSVFVKPNGAARYVQLTFSSAGWGSAQYVNYDLVGNTVVSQNGGATGTITSYANGWFRLTITATSIASPAAGSPIILAMLNAGTDGRAASYTGTNRQIQVWQTQCEVGVFASSPIPTTSSAVTRDFDDVRITGTNFSSWYPSTVAGVPGTLYWHGAMVGGATGTNQFLVCISDSGVGEEVAIYHGTAARTMIIRDGNVDQANTGGGGVATPGVPFKLAFGFDTNDVALYLAGALIGSDATVTLPTVNRLTFMRGETSFKPNEYVSRLAYFPSRLSNTQLAALTT